MSIYFEATSQTTAERVACHNDDIYYMCGCIIPGVSSLNGNVFTCLESVFLSPTGCSVMVQNVSVQSILVCTVERQIPRSNKVEENFQDSLTIA